MRAVGFTGTVQARAFGSQYDDDANTFLLEQYGLVDISASQQLLREVNVFVAVENLFDKDYDTGKILVTSPIGQGLLGKRIGEQAAIKVPKGTIKFEVLEIRYDL